MPREIVTHDWCDPCAEHEVQTPGRETSPITLGGMKPRTLILCETHEKEYIGNLKELLSEWGTIVESAERAKSEAAGATGVFPCMVPGCPKATDPYKYKTSLRNHVRETHNMGMREMQRRYGLQPTDGTQGELPLDHEPAPAAEKNPELTVADFTCGIDGCTKSYDPKIYSRPQQALGVHKAQAHGVKSQKRDARTKREKAGKK